MSSCRKPSPFVWVVLLLLSGVVMARAQADPPTRVRVTTAAPSRRVVGNLVSVEADTLRVATAKDSHAVALPRASVVRLEQSVGRRARTGHGAAVGVLVGAATGLLLGVAASSEDDSFIEIGPEEVLGATVFFAAAGGGIGALIGAASHTDRWQPMPVPGASAPEARRHRRRAALKLALRF